MMHRMIEILDVKFKKEDLQYEELAVSKETINASSF